MRLFLATLILACSFIGLISCSNQQNSKAEQNPPLPAIPDFSAINTEQVYAYNCADSVQFSAYVTQESTWVFMADTTVKVLPVTSASGARYESNGYLYWSKGDEAILQMPKGSFMTCTIVSQEKAWASAKIRGIDFRALGQEPGWFVELTHNKIVRYIGNYGKDTLSFDTPEPEKESQNGNTVYAMQNEGDSLRIEIADTKCTDSMSGFEFPYTVTLRVNGEKYNGCGRYL